MGHPTCIIEGLACWLTLCILEKIICNSTNSVQISFIETLKLIVFSWTIWWCYWQNVLMINEKNIFLTVSWLSGLLSAEMFISTGEWGVQMPPLTSDKQRVLMHGHQGWNVRHGLCHIYVIDVYIWVVYSFCLFCCLFIIVTTQFVALYKPCKPKPKPSTYDPPPPPPPPPPPLRTTTPWQRSKFRYLDRSQSNKYAINMQIQTISVSK